MQAVVLVQAVALNEHQPTAARTRCVPPVDLPQTLVALGDAAARMVEGTARSMGVEVVEG